MGRQTTTKGRKASDVDQRRLRGTTQHDVEMEQNLPTLGPDKRLGGWSRLRKPITAPVFSPAPIMRPEAGTNEVGIWLRKVMGHVPGYLPSQAQVSAPSRNLEGLGQQSTYCSDDPPEMQKALLCWESEQVLSSIASLITTR